MTYELFEKKKKKKKKKKKEKKCFKIVVPLSGLTIKKKKKFEEQIFSLEYFYCADMKGTYERFS